VKFADDLPLDLAADQAAIREHNAELDRRRDALERDRQALIAPHRERLKAERMARLTDEERRWLAEPDDRHPEERRPRIAALRKQVEPPEGDVKAALAEPEKARHADLEGQLARIPAQRRAFTTGLLMTDQEHRSFKATTSARARRSFRGSCRRSIPILRCCRSLPTRRPSGGGWLWLDGSPRPTTHSRRGSS